MAWNPSPKVAAARDFGQKFGANQVILLYIDSKTGLPGYASYGATKALCDHAELLADVAFDAVMKRLEEE